MITAICIQWWILLVIIVPCLLFDFARKQSDPILFLTMSDLVGKIMVPFAAALIYSVPVWASLKLSISLVPSNYTQSIKILEVVTIPQVGSLIFLIFLVKNISQHIITACADMIKNVVAKLIT